MLQIDFFKFLREGQITGLNVSCTEENVIRLLGPPGEVEDYGKQGKFLHYDFLRVGILGGHLFDVTFFFYNTTASFSLTSYDTTYVIEKDTPLTSLLALLNEWGVRWEVPYQESNLDYAVVKVSNGTKVYYYLHDNSLERISKSFGIEQSPGKTRPG